MATEDDDEDVSEAAAPAEGTGTPAPPAASPAPGTAPAPAGPSGPALDGLVVTPAQMEKTRQQLAAIQRAKSASDQANADAISARIDKDRQRTEDKYNAVGTDLPGAWDSQAKSAQHYTDPVQAFGSVGSVFAMLASSFAGLPMEAGLNAGAAAINAVHAGDEKAYNREFEAWKANTDLAIKRHDIQRQAYNDATTLMNSDINAGRTKMELAATKFGDQKVQALLDNGMDKELTDLFVARNKAATEMQDQWDKVQLQHDKVTDLRSDPRFTSGNQELKNQAISEWTQRWAPGGQQKLRYDAKADYIASQKRANPSWTPDDMLKWNTDFADAEGGSAETGGLKGNTPDKVALKKFMEEHATDNDGKGPSSDELSAFMQKLKTKPAGPLTSGKQKAAAIQQIVDSSAKEVEAGTRAAPKTIADATAEYNRSTATPSGNRLDDIDKSINMYENGTQAIDRTLALINKHVGAVGVAGYATRLGERLGNIAGSNETDRSQLAHDIQYLQTVAPRLMQDASSRGLKAEADKVNSMIAGLNIGDTTANTKRALTEVRDLWSKMKDDSINRRRGNPSPTSGAGPQGGEPGTPSSAKPTTGKTMPWQKDPIVKPADGATGPRAEGDVSDPNFWLEASA